VGTRSDLVRLDEQLVEDALRLALGQVSLPRAPLAGPDAPEHPQVLDAGGVAPLRAPAITGLALDAAHVPGHGLGLQISERNWCGRRGAHAWRLQEKNPEMIPNSTDPTSRYLT